MQAIPARAIIAYICYAQTLLFAVPGIANPATRPADEAPLVDAANRFALNLYQGALDHDQNVVLSPYCTFVSLAILREGAAGKTSHAIGQLLGESTQNRVNPARLHSLNDFLSGANQTDDTLICKITNGLWIDKQLSPDPTFLEAIHQNFGVEIRRADFGANRAAICSDINLWAERQTHGKIVNLSTPDTLGAAGALVSAIYFNGKWVHPFDEKNTKDGDFHLSATKAVKTHMMHLDVVNDYYHGDGVQLVKMRYNMNAPYDGANCDFVVILPDERDGLAELERTLDVARLSRWLAASHWSQDQRRGWQKREPDAADTRASEKWAAEQPRRQVHLTLPRFGVRSRLNLDAAMAHAGAREIFGSKADFSRIGIPGFGLSELIQAVRIDVNEKGTEAAAAQEYGLFGSEEAPPVTMTADHPFLFLIRESATGTILFIGHVCDPSAEPSGDKAPRE